MSGTGIDFATFLRLVHGHEPFPWQAELVETWLLQGRLPAVIDVPTGLGKTSVLDCWAFALASRPGGGEGVPLRLCFIVDRRLIVDAAFKHAQTLSCKLTEALKDGGPLREIAAALSALSGGAEPLSVVRMRGGATWESRWLSRPDQPAIVVGTVDQFGSRLLFRGYGASARMRPIDAALVGTDSWLVIDEAHIADPLVQTAKRAARLQETAAEPIARPLRMTAMTATPVAVDDPVALRADPDEQTKSSRFPNAAAEARRRLEAEKPTVLVELPAAKGRRTARERAGEVGVMLATLARRLGSEAELVGVLCNTVVAARAAHSALSSAGEDAALLVGRCREFERERVLREWLPRIELGAKRDGRRRYVVATQTIEVGADLDLDAAVCEVASIDALIQRFGRVNRSGRRNGCASILVYRPGHHDDDPVYGPAAAATWAHLVEKSGRAVSSAVKERQLADLPLDEASLDLGPLNARRLGDAAPTGARQEAGYVPVLLGSDVERWAATNPAPEPDQDVAPFLRGRVEAAPEVYIAWRAGPPHAADSEDGWVDWLAAARPVEWEYVAIPIWEARALVADEPPAAALSDQEGRQHADEEANAEPAATASDAQLIGVAYTDDPAQLRPIRTAADLRVGSHVILRADIGGHDRWGWTGLRASEANAVPDVGDLAPTRRRGVIRLDAGVLGSLLGKEHEDPVQNLLARLDPDEPDSASTVLSDLVELAAGNEELRGLCLRALEESWRLDLVPWASLDAQLAPAPVLRAPTGRAVALEAATDADAASTSQAGARETLHDHVRAVAAQARIFAEHLGLDDRTNEAIWRAALWHDLGKAEPRFQTMLHDGDELAALAAEEPLAKSGRDSADPIAREGARLAGVPRGFRHEAVSARMLECLAEKNPELIEKLDRELIHHLIASHHGNARPLLPPLVDPDPPPVTVTVPHPEDGPSLEITVVGAQRQVDWNQPARFEALCQRYGWWGLALLEAIVRLADMLVSEQGVNGVRQDEPAQTASSTR